MKLFILFCLSQILLCTLVCADHGGPHDEDHDHHSEPKAFLQIAPANLKFTYKLYYHLAATHPNSNIFFSSFSISTAFSLLALGAKSKTLSQIREGFCFNTSLISEETIHKGFKQFLNIINQPKGDLKLDSTNALFIDNKVKLLDKFIDDAKNWYHSEAISTDFQNVEEALTQINSYVEKKTDGKIKDLLDDLDPLTALVIVNTIFFKGSWKHPFNVNHTREEDFHVDEDKAVKVPMMFTHGEYLVAFLPEHGCTVVDVPYKGNMSAIIILPDEGKLHDVEKALQNLPLESWTKQAMRPMDILLSFPKFSLSYDLDLIEVLQHLGVKDVFSDYADLSGITGEDNMKVSKAVHKAVLTVDEEGTEAAAATMIGFGRIALPPHIIINRPFIFFITSEAGVLFSGRVINPTK